MKKLLISVDVEEWYMAENVRPYLAEETHPSSIHSSLPMLERLMQLFDSYNIKVTLFVVSDLLKKPECVAILSKAVAGGHEIASHSKSHRLLTDLTLEQTLEEVADSKRELEKMFSIKVKGFRAPCFSHNQFLDDCLRMSDYEYTSDGIEASFHDRYGEGARARELYDFAIPSFKLFGLTFPVTGGGWFRLLPVALQTYLLRRRDIVVFYCHPWDFDVDQPVVRRMPWLKRLRHTINNERAFSKLSHIIERADDCCTHAEAVPKL